MPSFGKVSRTEKRRVCQIADASSETPPPISRLPDDRRDFFTSREPAAARNVSSLSGTTSVARIKRDARNRLGGAPRIAYVRNVLFPFVPYSFVGSSRFFVFRIFSADELSVVFAESTPEFGTSNKRSYNVVSESQQGSGLALERGSIRHSPRSPILSLTIGRTRGSGSNDRFERVASRAGQDQGPGISSLSRLSSSSVVFGRIQVPKFTNS